MVATLGALLVQVKVAVVIALPLLSFALAVNWSVAFVLMSSGVADMVMVATGPGAVVVVELGVELVLLDEQPGITRHTIAVQKSSGARIPWNCNPLGPEIFSAISLLKYLREDLEWQRREEKQGRGLLFS
jgi:hypothetical protein